jgi:NAD(P)-dependent dehydrogenase (short-subunit alcohol dehydrogenase family)
VHGLRNLRTPHAYTQELFSLAGKTALITGGSRGLGLQMAEALGEQGAKRRHLVAQAGRPR